MIVDEYYEYKSIKSFTITKYLTVLKFMNIPQLFLLEIIHKIISRGVFIYALSFSSTNLSTSIIMGEGVFPLFYRSYIGMNLI